MLTPRLVCLDSSTWGNLARDWKVNADANRLLGLLNSGSVVPYFTWHHVEEIIQHADDDVYESRVSLIRDIRFVSYPMLPTQIGNIGSLMELRNFEIMALLQNPTRSTEKLVDVIRPEITNGFCTGKELCAANRPWWDYYRTHFAAEIQIRKAQIASIAQFPMNDQKQSLRDASKKVRLRSESDSKKQFSVMTQMLAERLGRDGDRRLGDPAQVSAEFMRKTYDESLRIFGMDGDHFERMLRLNNIERSRLPKNARMEDVGYEGIFRKHLELHETYLSLPPGQLHNQIRQDMVPSWITWREVDRAMKHFPKAAASNLNDRSIVSFALYVDSLECDKRIKDSVEQAARRHPLLAQIEKKLLNRKNYADLVTQLARIASA